MATVRPFRCIRPEESVASRVAALPYDVYSSSEARQEVLREPLSFLRVDRAETQFTDDVDTYDPRVYSKAKDLLSDMIRDGILISDEEECYYIYELTMDKRSQTGLVACASIDDYLKGTIKKHENTREDKELDRIKHVDICGAQTGPIFLTYRSRQSIKAVLDMAKKETPLYDFTANDGIRHRVWKINGSSVICELKEEFSKVDSIYIADGHHRAASAVKVGLKRRQDNPDYTGNEEFNYFLSVLFAHEELMIMPYNRAVRDLNGLSSREFIDRIRESFEVHLAGNKPYKPEEKASFGMYLDGCWYVLRAKKHLTDISDPVKRLDVSLLQDYLLKPVLGIEDPRTDKRIDFIGGIRGLAELERRVCTDMSVAFSMYPTSITELFAVSDAGMLMPPKSTWFEPKLRSGLFIHAI